MTMLVLSFSIRSWLMQVSHELTNYFEHLSTTQYAILAAATVAFGFLCLKGHAIRR